MERDSLEQGTRAIVTPRISTTARKWDIPANGKKAFVHQWNPLKWPRAPPSKTCTDRAATGQKAKDEQLENPVVDIDADKPKDEKVEASRPAEGRSSRATHQKTGVAVEDSRTPLVPLIQEAVPHQQYRPVMNFAAEPTVVTTPSVGKVHGKDHAAKRHKHSEESESDVLLDILLDRGKWAGPLPLRNPTRKPMFAVKSPLKPLSIVTPAPRLDKHSCYAFLLRSCCYAENTRRRRFGELSTPANKSAEQSVCGL